MKQDNIVQVTDGDFKDLYGQILMIVEKGPRSGQALVRVHRHVKPFDIWELPARMEVVPGAVSIHHGKPTFGVCTG